MKTHELYKTVTSSVIEQLERGTPPWTRPWKDVRVKGVGMLPSNLVTGRLYSGSNVLLLWMTATAFGYDSLQFCTYQQANEMGARVKKGSRSTHIIFTKHVRNKDEETDEERKSTIVKSYPVFHVSQLDGIPAKYLEPQEPDDARPMRERAFEFAKGTGVKISNGGNKAAYIPSTDEVVMPSLKAFETEDAYWGVLNHELTHATGHKSRCDRVFGKRFADPEYAFEELVAELGSAFLCARLGIEPSFRSASYIQNWLKVLKDDTRAIFSAASYAGHAADWLWKQAYPEDQQHFKQAAE